MGSKIRTVVAVLSLGLAAAAGAAFLLFRSAEKAPPKAPKKDRILYSNGIAVGKAWPGPQKKLYSQGNEELIIRDFFGDKKNGFFVDVGCSTPIANSTTYYLEKHLNWSGIGIDALPEHGRKFKLTRPKTKFRNFIVTDHSGAIGKFFRVPGATGLSSTKTTNTAFGRALRRQTIYVATITLTDLLKREGVEKIDFLSMDIEGGAPKALAGFDIQKYRPELVCIEAAGQEKFIKSYFAKHGYERIEKYRQYDFVNWYYRPAKRRGR